MLSDQDLEMYYKKLSNPMSVVSKNQRSMVDTFQIDVKKQQESQRRRQEIIAEKRRTNRLLIKQSTYQSPTPSIHSTEPTDSDTETESIYMTTINNENNYGEPEEIVDSRPLTPQPPVIIHDRSSSPLIRPSVVVSNEYEDIDQLDLQNERTAIYEAELRARMEDLGMQDSSSRDTRREELSYWRKKISLEEEAAVKQAGMLLSLLSSLVESFTNAVGFKTIKTQGLSDAIQEALENGDFDLAIKSYCVSPHALNMLKNPVTSFMTSFGHVILRTHIANVKRELQEGIDSFKRRKQEEHRREEMSAATNVVDSHGTSSTNNVPWNVPIQSVTDNMGHSRPRFELPSSSSTNTNNDVGASFRTQLKNIAPVIGAFQHFASGSEQKPEDTLVNPGELLMK